MKTDQTLDARGQLCPMPVLKASRAMKTLNPGQVLEILSTDKGSKTDIPAWCSAQKHTLLAAEDKGNEFRYIVQKGG